MSTPAFPPLEPPDSHLARAVEGWLELGLPDEAEAELDQLSSAAKAHPHTLDLCWQIHAHRKEWSLAHTVAELLVSVDPGNLSGWIHRAYAARRMEGGGLQVAWDALRPAAELFRAEFLVPYNLACYACQLGRLDAARHWLGRAYEAAGKSKARDGIKLMALADPDLAPMREQIMAGLRPGTA